MLAVLIAFASEEASQTPFYVLGGLAAVYAVVVASIGITQPEFPKDEGQARLVYLASTVVVVLAMASAILTS